MVGNTPVNILLVDDQPKNLLALEAMLGDMGETLVRAQSGQEALRRLLHEDYAVILLDVQMPELDGFETARLIRQREKSKDTPIIFVTALSRSESNVFTGYSLGAVDYLFKPIDPEILRSKVAVFVELFRKRTELAQLHERMELILNSTAEGIAVLSPFGEVRFLNPSGARLLGSSVKSLRGGFHDALHPPALAAGICAGLDCPLRLTPDHPTTRAVQKEDRFWRDDGTSFPVEYNAMPIETAPGELTGTVLSFADVTERKSAAAARENERLYLESQAANRAKDEFLATLSHELRTPMTAIVGWVRMLRLGGLDDETMQFALEAIEKATTMQTQLIEDMLDVSRIVSGKLRLVLEPVDLCEVVGRAVNTLRNAASEKQITLELIGETRCGIEGDAARLQQIVWNLVSNGIKFTPAGGRVSVSLHSGGDRVSIIVTDTGQGITADFLPHVFARFRQADSSNSRQHGGLGLGLSIARYLVEAHGGTITAHSGGEGQGATFIVSFPTTPLPDTAAPADETVSKGRARLDETRGVLAGSKILIVDDEPSVRALVHKILMRTGADVDAAASVAEALAIFDATRPDIVLTDIAMPGEDGYELLAKIRNRESRNDKHVPVVALSAYGRDEDRERARQAGFDRHLTKPIDPVELVSAIAETFASRER